MRYAIGRIGMNVNNSAGGTQTALERSESRGWTPKPAAAFAVRAAQIVLPFIAGWLAIRWLRPVFLGVDGTGFGTFLLWLIQAIFVATVVSATVTRLLSRFTPLVALLNMSLVFPDSVPSRFGLALKTGTVKRLMAEPNLQLSSSAQLAAEEAVQLVTHLGKHEPLTRGHTERVRAYADVIGQQMGLSEQDLNGLRWGALLHDIGKLTVPAEILNKAGKPTAEEWEILRGHPGAAVPILEPLHDWLGDWLLAAPQHHERFDGTGYPAGVSGQQISLAGRITAVADAYDVITSRRSYKEAKSPEFAREEMVRSAGSHFDPVVVKALLEAGVSRSWYGRRFGWLLELPAIVRALTAAGQVAAATTAAVAVSAFLPGTAPPGTIPDSLAIPEGLPFVESTADRNFADEESVDVVEVTIDSPGTDVPLVAETSTTSTTLLFDETEEEVVTSTTAPQSSTSTTVPVTTTTRVVTPSTRPPLSNPNFPTSTTTTTVQTTTTTTTSTTTTTQPPTQACVDIWSGVTFLPGADLRGCDLSNLQASGLHLANARLDGVDMTGVSLTDFNLEGANLTDALLREATLLRGSFRDAELVDATVQRTSFTEVGFQNADLRGISIGGSGFTDSSFEGADLRDASFNLIRVVRTNFKGVDIRGLNLSFRNLSSVDFSGARIDDVNFKGTDLTNTVFAGATGTPADVANATFDNTICPNGSASNSSCW